MIRQGNRNLFCTLLFRFSAAAFLFCIAASQNFSGRADAAGLSDVPRTQNFSYFELGTHVPSGSGHKNYDDPRKVIHDGIGLPIEVDPKNGKHMYCNTQLYYVPPWTCGVGANQKYKRSNASTNLQFPWFSTFCEHRPGSRQYTRACGRNRPEAHQGTDCRPPTAEGNAHWAVAVEDGKIQKVYEQSHGWTIKYVGRDSQILWVYRHGSKPIVGRNDTVKKGDRLMPIRWLCTTHLHLESIVNGRHMDNMPSLIRAYKRALDVELLPLVDGNLTFDPRFEVSLQTAARCRQSQDYPQISSAYSGRFESFWCHNDSLMGLVRENGRVLLVYDRPRPGIADVVKSQPVLLDVSRSGASVSGTGRHYSSRCGSRTFPVSGVIDEAERRLSATGSRPVFSSGDCGETSSATKTETLLFSFVRNAGADDGPPDGPAVPTEPPTNETDVGDETGGTGGTGESGEDDSAPPSGGVAGKPSSIWRHNGSEMALYADGDSRTLTYHAPRTGLQGIVSAGTVLFTGKTTSAGTYEGQASWFRKGCAPQPYDVSGPIESGGARIVLTGERPKIEADCSVTGTAPDRLIFTFLRRADSTDSDPGGGPAESKPALAAQCERARCVDRDTLFRTMQAFWTEDKVNRRRRNPILLPEQLDAVQALVNVWETEPRLAGSNSKVNDDKRIAYIIATVYHETTKNLYPTRECSCRTNVGSIACVRRLWQKGIAQPYHRLDPATGHSYYGRGQTQLTLKENFIRVGNKLGVGRGLYEKPDRSLDLTVSARNAVLGLYLGWYRARNGKWLNLKDIPFTRDRDWIEARQVLIGTRADREVAQFARRIHRGVQLIDRATFLARYGTPADDSDPGGGSGDSGAGDSGQPETGSSDPPDGDTGTPGDTATDNTGNVPEQEDDSATPPDWQSEAAAKVADLRRRAETLSDGLSQFRIELDSLAALLGNAEGGVVSAKSLSGAMAKADYVSTWPSGHRPSSWCDVSRKSANDIPLDPLDPVLQIYGSEAIYGQ